MNKKEFLALLKTRLNGLPKADIDRSLEYYAELLDDRVEEGMGEEEAVASLPPMDDIVAQIVGEVPFTKLVGERLKPKRRLKGWEIAMIVIGSPLWLSLLVVALSLVLAAFAVVWSVVIAVGAVIFSFAAVGVAETIAGIASLFAAKFADGAMLLGVGFIFVGLAIVVFLATRKLPKGTLLATKKLLIWIKKCFIKGVEA